MRTALLNYVNKNCYCSLAWSITGPHIIIESDGRWRIIAGQLSVPWPDLL